VTSAISINQKPVETIAMSLVPGIPKTCSEAFAGGLFYGSMFCTVLCSPLLAFLLTLSFFVAPIDTLVFAVLFALGTFLSLTLLLGEVTASVLEQASLFRKRISTCGPRRLISLCFITLLTTIMVALGKA
jgi:hypothetical protein